MIIIYTTAYWYYIKNVLDHAWIWLATSYSDNGCNPCVSAGFSPQATVGDVHPTASSAYWACNLKSITGNQWEYHINRLAATLSCLRVCFSFCNQGRFTFKLRVCFKWDGLAVRHVQTWCEAWTSGSISKWLVAILWTSQKLRIESN